MSLQYEYDDVCNASGLRQNYYGESEVMVQ